MEFGSATRAAREICGFRFVRRKQRYSPAIKLQSTKRIAARSVAIGPGIPANTIERCARKSEPRFFCQRRWSELTGIDQCSLPRLQWQRGASAKAVSAI